MKQMEKMVCCVMAASLAVIIGGCASTEKIPVQAAQTAISAQAARTASNMEVLDWKSRGLGEFASPDWLLPAVRGDWSVFRRAWNAGEGKILKIVASPKARASMRPRPSPTCSMRRGLRLNSSRPC
jgi:hypothetical protein